MRSVHILVLADTHIPRRARTLPARVLQALDHADLILHAGDILERSVLEYLERHAPVVAVAGNNDRDLAAVLPRRAVVTVRGVRIGVVHGDGVRSTTLSRAKAAFRQEAVQCVVFGHSHQPLLLRQENVLYLNPGSATDRRRQPHCSFAWLEVGADLAATHVFFDREKG